MLANIRTRRHLAIESIVAGRESYRRLLHAEDELLSEREDEHVHQQAGDERRDDEFLASCRALLCDAHVPSRHTVVELALRLEGVYVGGDAGRREHEDRYEGEDAKELQVCLAELSRGRRGGGAWSDDHLSSVCPIKYCLLTHDAGVAVGREVHRRVDVNHVRGDTGVVCGGLRVLVRRTRRGFIGV